MSPPKVLVCPYCGETQAIGERCVHCAGLFEPLSRQATHNAMGAWFIRDPAQPFRPGCSYETLLSLVARGKVIKTTIIRGPTTGQFWTIARRVQGLSHLFGYCHHCDGPAEPADHGCEICGVSFVPPATRNSLGLPPIRSLDGTAVAEPSTDRSAVVADPGSTISAFAPDAVLRHEGHDTWTPETSIPSPAAAAPDDLELAATVGHLQRRLRAQRRIMLGLGMTALLLAAILVVAYVLRPDPPPSKPVATPPAPAPSTPAPAAPKPSPTTAPTPATAPATAPASAPADAPTLAPVLELIRQGEDRDRSIDERRTKLQEAQRMLDDLAATGGADLPSLEVRALQERIRTALERLELSDFFPES